VLEQAGCTVVMHDPFFSEKDVLSLGKYNAVALLVPHTEYVNMSAKQIAALMIEDGIFFDLKSIFTKEDIEREGLRYISL
jgi:hypothetical protein